MANSENDENTIEERIAGFEAKVVAHPILKSVFEEVLAITRHPAGASLLLVIGPTGVGKTTLINRLEQQLQQDGITAMHHDPGFIPVAKVEAPSPDDGKFHWGDFYVRFLEAVHEPMIEHKTLEVLENEIRQRRKVSGTFSELRRAMENCIRHRGTKAIIVDEAQHLTKVPNARRMLDQMDAIKSLASLSGVLFILVGTYELLPLLNQSGQLARRSRLIHFPRYQLVSREDQARFRSVMATFQKAMPFAGGNALLPQFNYLYQGSLGCIGILKDWLKRAVVQALTRDSDSLTLADLEATAHGNDTLLQIFREIQLGEAQIEHNQQCGDELRKALGLEQKNYPTKPVNGKTTQRRGSVGERKPARDPVGVTI